MIIIQIIIPFHFDRITNQTIYICDQERVNRLENLCYAAKEVLNLEEAATFLGIAKSTLYKMTHENHLPYFKPSGKLIFFEKKALLDWVRGAKSKSVDEIKEEAAAKIMEMNERQ